MHRRLRVAVLSTGDELRSFGESLGPIMAGRLISGIGIGASLPAIRRIVILADPEGNEFCVLAASGAATATS